MSDTSFTWVEAYADPVLYDVANTIVDEMPILLRLAKETGGPILDLACGTGRTTLPMAEAGFKVTGVDINAGMLERAREKARERGLAIEFFQQDCTELDLSLTARMVTMNGHAFQEFLTNEAQDALLRSVNRHLDPGGVFIFDTRFPSRENLFRPEGEQHWGTSTDEQGRTLVASVIWSYDALTQVQDYIFIDRLTDDAGVTEETRSIGHLRYTWPRELERLLNEHRFDLETIYGNWEEAPLAEDSYDMVVIARKRG